MYCEAKLENGWKICSVSQLYIYIKSIGNQDPIDELFGDHQGDIREIWWKKWHLLAEENPQWKRLTPTWNECAVRGFWRGWEEIHLSGCKTTDQI